MALVDNLEAFWNLEDLTDASGNSHSLTNNNSATFTAGKLNNAATFARASAQALTIPFASLGDLVVSAPFSVSVWFKRTVALGTLQSAYIFHIGRANSNNPGEGGLRLNLGRAFAAETLNLAITGGGSAAVAGFSIAAPTIDVWHHVGFAVDASDVLTCFINGTSQSVTQYVAPLNPPGNDLGIGGQSVSGVLSNHLNGQVDLAGVWSRALSEAEFLELYNSGAGLDPTAEPESPPAGGGLLLLGIGG